MTESIRFNQTLEPEQDHSVNLLMLIQQYKDGTLKAPEHQRDANAWAKTKQNAYIQRIRNGIRSIGCFVTYEIINGDGITYINDGLQRLTAALRYHDYHEEYGDSLKIAVDVLKKYSVTKQHRWYPDHVTAMADFQAINIGTALDAYEFGHGHLGYANGWQTTWASRFNQWHQEMNMAFSALSSIPESERAKQKKQKLLHNYGLLIRHVTKDRRVSSFRDITANKPKPELFEAKQSVFQRVAAWLDLSSHTQIEDGMKETLNAYKLDIAAIREAFYRNPFPNGIAKSNAHKVPFVIALHLLEIGVFARNIGKYPAPYIQFLDDFMKRYDGISRVIGTNGYSRHVGASINHLREECQLINSSFYEGMRNDSRSEEPVKRATTKKPPLFAGNDYSHVNPYSTHGDGPTFPELASINRSRGAKPVENPPAEYLFGGAE